MVKKFKAVLFDFDGVIADTIKDLCEAWKKAFKEYGIEIKTEDYCPLEGMKMTEIARTLSKKYGKEFNDEECFRIKELKDRYYLENCSFKFYPKIEEIVEELLRVGKRLAIVSASPKEKLEKTVPKKFLDKFEVVISGEDTEEGKPSPEPYLNAVKKLEVKREDCIVVENAPLGIKSAKKAGIYCVALSTTLGEENLQEADLVLKNHNELRNFFKNSVLGKTVLITGSSKGLGKNLALVFAENKFNVILHGRNEEDLGKVKEDIVKKGVNCDIVLGDLVLDSTLERLAKIARERNISVLINNAAIGANKLLKELEWEEIENILKTNLNSVIKLTNKVYPIFSEKKNGVIININSMDGLARGGENRSIYSAAKHGLKGFTDCMRFEGKKEDIKVIGVYLNGMKTGLYSLFGGDDSTCMEPKEVAEVIFKICSMNYSSLDIDDIVVNRKRY